MTAPTIAPATETRLHLDRERLNVLEGRAASVTGALRPALAGGVVALQLASDGAWRTVTSTRTSASGRFTLRYLTGRTGSRRVRVRFAGDGFSPPAARVAGTLNVFHLAGASWYGGGGSLACGGWLTSETLGVANKTLPCGTLVTLRYDGRTVRVPVVDRGPFVPGREFDLTEATKQALDFSGVGEVWSTS
jgi:hypothetical protein